MAEAVLAARSPGAIEPSGELRGKESQGHADILDSSSSADMSPASAAYKSAL